MVQFIVCLICSFSATYSPLCSLIDSVRLLLGRDANMGGSMANYGRLFSDLILVFLIQYRQIPSNTVGIPSNTVGIPSEYRQIPSNTIPNTVKYRQIPSSETKKLDFDTYAMPGALVWADLHHFSRLRVWEGSRPKIGGSGTKN